MVPYVIIISKLHLAFGFEIAASLHSTWSCSNVDKQTKSINTLQDPFTAASLRFLFLLALVHRWRVLWCSEVTVCWVSCVWVQKKWTYFRDTDLETWGKSGFLHKRNKERCELALSQRLCPPVSPSAIRGYKALVCSSSAVFQLLRPDTSLQNLITAKNTLTHSYLWPLRAVIFT